MEEVRRSYSRLCKESGAEPQETVLQRLQELPRGRLDLATQSLTADTCRALGKLLQKEALVTELVLSDCMLSEEGGHRGRPGRDRPRSLRVGAGVQPLASGSLPLSRLPPAPRLLHCTELFGPSPLVFCSDDKQRGPLKPGSRGQFLLVPEKPSSIPP